eukprot:m.322975 g.322975  ORF g.322975 m.322975 type:complete len:485 (+) comp16538_c1_seq1:230-1684(+)
MSGAKSHWQTAAQAMVGNRTSPKLGRKGQVPPGMKQSFPVISEIKVSKKTMSKAVDETSSSLRGVWHKISALPDDTKTSTATDIITKLDELSELFEEYFNTLSKDIRQAKTAIQGRKTIPDERESTTETVSMGLKENADELEKAAKDSPTLRRASKIQEKSKSAQGDNKSSSSPLLRSQSTPVSGSPATTRRQSKLNISSSSSDSKSSSPPRSKSKNPPIKEESDEKSSDSVLKKVNEQTNTDDTKTETPKESTTTSKEKELPPKTVAKSDATPVDKQENVSETVTTKPKSALELQKEALAQMEELEKQYKKEMERAEQARAQEAERTRLQKLKNNPWGTVSASKTLNKDEQEAEDSPAEEMADFELMEKLVEKEAKDGGADKAASDRKIEPKSTQETPPKLPSQSATEQSDKESSDASQWGVEEVCNWAKSNKFDEAIFRDNEVDGLVLLELDEEMLRDDLGLTSKLKRTKVLTRIGLLKSEQ